MHLRICSDNLTCCHTEIEVADQTFYWPHHNILTLGRPVPVLTLSCQAPGRTATGVPVFKSLVWLDLKKSRCKRDSNSRSSSLEADALTTRRCHETMKQTQSLWYHYQEVSPSFHTHQTHIVVKSKLKNNKNMKKRLSLLSYPYYSVHSNITKGRCGCWTEVCFIDTRKRDSGKGRKVLSFIQVSHSEGCSCKLDSCADMCPTHTGLTPTDNWPWQPSG